jgi:hypothetical protein
MRFDTQYEKVFMTDSGFKYLNLKSGRRVMFFHATDEVKKCMTPLYRWTSRMFKLVDSPDKDIAESNWDTLDWRLFEIESWIKAVREHYEKEHGVVRKERNKRDRILALREIAGRTPEEAAMFLAKADQLEQEMES